jgi:nitrogenase molybdenum-iron protein NifN
MISHFREPIDIASSNFSEETAVFGGDKNLKTAIDNVISQYQPSLIGVSSTCLSETIGDDVSLALREYRSSGKGSGTPVIHVSTPSYKGTHAEGFRAAVKSTVEALAEGGECNGGINMFPPVVSPEDIRHLKEITSDFGLKTTILPDYSESLDGAVWENYMKLPVGGTPVDEIKRMGQAAASIEIGTCVTPEQSAGRYLSSEFSHKYFSTALPLGIDANDDFFSILSKLSGNPIPEKYQKDRGRLADSYIDAHKYLSGKKAVVFGEPDMATGISRFLGETGIETVLCATASRGIASGFMSAPESIHGVSCNITDDSDFVTMLELCGKLKPDIIIGSSKGFYLSRRLEIPLVRAGFPVHDRFGGQRLMHTGYRGTQQLFDRIVNALMEHKQNSTNIGYSYI